MLLCCTVCIVGAVQRYFESRRRHWRESTATDPRSQERVAQQSLRRRIRSRQQRVYTCILCVFLDLLCFYLMHMYSSITAVRRWARKK